MNVTASETLGMNNIIQFLRHREQLIVFTKTNCIMLCRNMNATLSHVIHKNSVVEELLNVKARGPCSCCILVLSPVYCC